MLCADVCVCIVDHLSSLRASYQLTMRSVGHMLLAHLNTCWHLSVLRPSFLPHFRYSLYSTQQCCTAQHSTTQHNTTQGRQTDISTRYRPRRVMQAGERVMDGG